MDALRYLRRHPNVRKAELVIGRFQSETYGNSRPCLHCIRRILRYHSNIVAVTFFEDGKWITQRPGVCELYSRLSSGERLAPYKTTKMDVTLKVLHGVKIGRAVLLPMFVLVNK